MEGETWARHGKGFCLGLTSGAEANPMDGISGQKFDGPWLFRPVRFPKQILDDIIKFLEK